MNINLFPNYDMQNLSLLILSAHTSSGLSVACSYTTQLFQLHHTASNTADGQCSVITDC